MAQETLGDVVAALVDSYAAGLKWYTDWRQRQWQHNHYRTRGTTNTVGSETCGASSSLMISKLKIEEMFNDGADMLGEEFILGDAACHDALKENTRLLQECIEILQSAVDAKSHPLRFSEVIRVSEAVRVSSLAALHKQYQCVVVGRLVPREPSPSTKLPSTVYSNIEKLPSTVYSNVEKLPSTVYSNVEGECGIQLDIPQTRGQRTDSKALARHCEPPSPPLTPTRASKPPANDTQPTSPADFDPRPRNSVFSVFCPEAMKYQVDLEKTLPNGIKCRCGYDWNSTCAEAKAAMVLKYGFQMTSRFLGKSHFEKGLGCVLCTSSGKTDTFDSVEGLKAHINSSHTKWQLLHDRDLVDRWSKST
ncbi:hypothetical protein HD806DRAFT_498939, partial [Xylariaceae sp. AK1471]